MRKKIIRVLAVLAIAILVMAQQPVTVSSGTVTANIGTSGSLALDSSLTTLDTDVKANVTLHAGTNIVGKVTTDQTTHGTTDLVAADITKIGGNAVTTTDNGTQGVAPQATSSSTGALAACNILSAASTNSTNCKGSAGNFYGFEIYNNTTTIYYLRLYNTASAPTCSSATGFIRSIPIKPADAAGGLGGAISNQQFPVNYPTGISFCITGGSSSTDNTNAAVGIFGEIRYK